MGRTISMFICLIVCLIFTPLNVLANNTISAIVGTIGAISSAIALALVQWK